MYTGKGFTLVELMIGIAIVAILAAVAYPSYTDYVRSARRADAQADLVAFAGAMERHKAATYSYVGAAAPASAPVATGSPWIFSTHSPADGPAANKVYDLTISAADGNSYTLLAKPVSGSAQDGDGDLSLEGNGRQSWDQDDDGTFDADERCWNC